MLYEPEKVSSIFEKRAQGYFYTRPRFQGPVSKNVPLPKIDSNLGAKSVRENVDTGHTNWIGIALH